MISTLCRASHPWCFSSKHASPWAPTCLPKWKVHCDLFTQCCLRYRKRILSKIILFGCLLGFPGYFWTRTFRFHIGIRMNCPIYLSMISNWIYQMLKNQHLFPSLRQAAIRKVSVCGWSPHVFEESRSRNAIEITQCGFPTYDFVHHKPQQAASYVYLSWESDCGTLNH